MISFMIYCLISIIKLLFKALPRIPPGLVWGVWSGKHVVDMCFVLCVCGVWCGVCGVWSDVQRVKPKPCIENVLVQTYGDVLYDLPVRCATGQGSSR